LSAVIETYPIKFDEPHVKGFFDFQDLDPHSNLYLHPGVIIELKFLKLHYFFKNLYLIFIMERTTYLKLEVKLAKV